jgi:hypothetical protein
MKHPQQLKTAPLNRAADLLAEKHTSFSDKTARQINAPFTPEIHIVSSGDGGDVILGELFKACGWLVIYEPKEMAKSPRRRLQPLAVCKPKGTRRRSKV